MEPADRLVLPVPEPPRPAVTVGWPELLGHPDVVESAVLDGPVGVMAFHGGLEAGTLQIARATAGATGASLYTVDQPTALRWHVPSHEVDPVHSTALAGWLAHVSVAIALHGYGRTTRRRQVLLGGTNRGLAGRLRDRLAGRLPEFTVVDDLEDIPVELRGTHPNNPVNRPPRGGVQVELPASARGALPGDAPARVVDALVETIRELERDGADGRPRRARTPSARIAIDGVASSDKPSGR